MKYYLQALLHVMMAFVFLFLAGCSNDQELQKAKKYLKELKAVKTENRGSTSFNTELPIIYYSASHMRSPFQSNVNTDSDKSQPLQQYPLNTLRLVGTITTSENNWGLISVPTGMIYRIAVGETLGQVNARVVAIGRNFVELTEPYSENSRQQVRRIKLALGS